MAAAVVVENLQRHRPLPSMTAAALLIGWSAADIFQAALIIRDPQNKINCRLSH